MKKFLSFLLLTVISVALAQDTTNPNLDEEVQSQSMVVEPPSSADNQKKSVAVKTPEDIVVNPEASYTVDLWLDKRNADGSVATYQIGETISLGVQVNDNAYVYVFSLHSDGSVDQIFPNGYDSDNFLYANQPRYLGTGDTFLIRIAGPSGVDKAIAVASRSPLDTSILASFNNQEAFFAAGSHSNQEEFAQNLSFVVETNAQQDWVTDTEQFNVNY